MPSFRVLLTQAFCCGSLLLAACNGTESPPEGHGTPVEARLFVAGEDVSTGFALAPGATTRAEVRFYDDDGMQITGIEDEHFAAITVTPSALLAVSDVAGQHFQKDLTASNTEGTGTYKIGYGHDAAADETAFGPFDVTVVQVGMQ